jgi:DNA-binding transcriptional LysR family regulator
MELRQLRHFVALAEEHSLTGAARRELIVQSGLSNSVRALERELGTDLYVRGTRPVRLTAAGEALLAPAREALHAADTARRAVHETSEVLTGRLRLGISLSAQHLVPFAAHLGAFLREHPGVDVRMRPAAALAMLDMVEGGELDCAIGPALEQRGRLRLTPLATEPLALTCRRDHPLAGRDRVTLTDLAGERFVEVPPGWTARLLSDALFAGAGQPRRIVAEVGDWEILLEMIAAGAGIGFTPAGLRYELLTGPGSLLSRINVDGVQLERRLYLILPPPAETSPAAATFAATVLAHHAPASPVTLGDV